MPPVQKTNGIFLCYFSRLNVSISERTFQKYHIHKIHALLQFKRTRIQLIIFSFFFNQLIVTASLNDMSLLKNHDNIRVLYCRKSVSDNKYGTSLHQSIHTTLNNGFCSRIDGRSCLIQNHNRRICNCRTSNRDQLSLSLG